MQKTGCLWPVTPCSKKGLAGLQQVLFPKGLDAEQEGPVETCIQLGRAQGGQFPGMGSFGVGSGLPPEERGYDGQGDGHDAHRTNHYCAPLHPGRAGCLLLGPRLLFRGQPACRFQFLALSFRPLPPFPFPQPDTGLDVGLLQLVQGEAGLPAQRLCVLQPGAAVDQVGLLLVVRLPLQRRLAHALAQVQFGPVLLQPAP